MSTAPASLLGPFAVQADGTLLLLASGQLTTPTGGHVLVLNRNALRVAAPTPQTSSNAAGLLLAGVVALLAAGAVGGLWLRRGVA